MSWVIITVVRPELAVQRAVILAERVAGERIERAERLVHQHDLRPGGERAGDADALALAAGQLRGKARRGAFRGRGGPASSSSSTRAAIRASSQPSSFGVIAMFSATVMCGNRPTPWNT